MLYLLYLIKIVMLLHKSVCRSLKLNVKSIRHLETISLYVKFVEHAILRHRNKCNSEKHMLAIHMVSQKKYS